MPFSFFNFSFPQEITSKEKEMYFNEVEFYFPKDLQLSTWRFLSPIELCCVSRVCKSFNQTSSLDELWIHFVRNHGVSKDYKKLFIEKMKQSWKNFFNHPKCFSSCFSQRLFNEDLCPKARRYKALFPQLSSKKIPNYGVPKPKNLPLNTSSEYDFLFKILLRGDSGVGKTSLLERFVDDTFTDSFLSTIGVDFKIKTINIGNKIIKLQIWDTAGQERFRSTTNPYYRAVHGVIIIGDDNIHSSLESMARWREEAEKHASPDTNYIYCINKIDLKKSELSEKDIKKYIPENEKWIQTSAKTRENVDELFETMTKMILNRFLGLEPEICWDENWSSENLHTVIPNLESVLRQLEKNLVETDNDSGPPPKSCQIQ